MSTPGLPTSPETLLLSLTGSDRPGVTSTFLTALAEAGVEVLDMEQIVMRGRLILGLLVTAPRDWKKLAATAQRSASALGMDLTVEPGSGDNQARGAGRTRVSVIGAPLRAKALGALTGRIADLGANIDRIERMARYPVTAIDFHVSGVDPLTLREALTVEAARVGVDVAVQPAGLLRHGTRLIVMDVDSTLIQGEVIDMLAEHAGRGAQVAAITAAAMAGQLDFESALRERVGALAGLPVSVLDEVYASIILTPGARTLIRTLKRLGYHCALVSGGFSAITERLAADLGADYSRANVLEVKDGHLTGKVIGPIVDRAGKAAALREFAAQSGLLPQQTIAIGDGANDLDMLAAAGLGVAYNARPVVQDAADTAVNVPYLDAVLFLLGITREEVEAADAEDEALR